MTDDAVYLLLADLMLGAHVLIVIFIIAGQLLIVIGKLAQWAWVRNPWFRVMHLVAIGVVVVQSWLGQSCPLTVWEMSLRGRAGESTYAGSFISHWLGELLYIAAPDWAFVVAYSLFGALVLASWYWVRPRAFFDRAV